MVLSEDERRELVRRVGSQLTSVQAAQRARIVLLAANGKQNREYCRDDGDWWRASNPLV